MESETVTMIESDVRTPAANQVSDSRTATWIAASGAHPASRTRHVGPKRQALASPTEATPTATSIFSTVLPQPAMEDGEVKWVHTERSRLEVLDRIGEGGAGEVFAAIDHDIGRKVAIKKIRSGLESPHMLMRFVEEIHTVGKLEHPNIVPIHDVGLDESGDYYFVMKYVDGETLDSIIEKLRAGDSEALRVYTFERRVELFRGLLEALHYAHSRGVLHRDIKPENVMVGPFGEVLLMDWGIAREAGRSPHRQAHSEAPSERFWGTLDGGLVGTPPYMSPEQARGSDLDVRSDVYSASALLYELLTLHHYLEDREELEDILDGVKLTNPSLMSFAAASPPVPMDLVWFVRKGMQKDRTRRYQSIGEMTARLDARADGVVPIECHLTLAKRVNGVAMAFSDRHPMLATLGMMGTLGMAIVGMVGAFF